MKSIVNLDVPLVSPPSYFEGDFFKGKQHFMSVGDVLCNSRGEKN